MKVTHLLLFSFISICCWSQSNEHLKTAAKKLYDANYLMDIEVITSMTYPKVYEIIGKEEFNKKQDSFFQNEEYRFRLQLPTVAMIYGEMIKVNKTTYCLVTFKNPIRYFFEEQLTTEKATEKAKHLKEINVTKDVTFEPKRNSFNVRKTSTYIAILEEQSTNNWTFINLDDAFQREYVLSNFDTSLKEKLGL